MVKGFKHDLLWTSIASKVLFSPPWVDRKLEGKGGKRNLVEISLYPIP